MFPEETASLALEIGLAILLGGMIGWQREMSHKPAGFRTHILIVLGATLVMETSHFAGSAFGGDPMRVASNVVVGIGFIGAGTIMKEGPTVYGLTTAATIWVAGALGLTIGAGYYAASFLLTAATLVVLVVFSRLESLGMRGMSARRYQVVAADDDAAIGRIHHLVERTRLRRGALDFRREHDRVFLSFEIRDTESQHEALFRELRQLRDVFEVRSS